MAMSCATKAKAEAGEACRGGEELGKMTFNNKVHVAERPQNLSFACFFWE
jgi:hypothetical protein